MNLLNETQQQIRNNCAVIVGNNTTKFVRGKSGNSQNFIKIFEDYIIIKYIKQKLKLQIEKDNKRNSIGKDVST